MQDLRPIERFTGFFEPDEVRKFSDLLLSPAEFPWFYHKSSIGLEDPEAFEDLPQLCHTFVYDGVQNSDYTSAVTECLGLLRVLTDLRVSGRLVRMKANLTMRYGAKSNPPPHHDLDAQAISALYYVNDSDGDTVFFDRAFGQDTEGMREVRRETPKAGDLLLFDSRQYHTGSWPVRTQARAVINCLIQ